MIGRPRVGWDDPDKKCRCSGVVKLKAEFTPRKGGDVHAWCKDCMRAASRASMAKRRAAEPDYSKSIHAKHRDKAVARRRVVYRQDPERYIQAVAKRRAIKYKATPGWADQSIIMDLYALRRIYAVATGWAWDMDHIVPLKYKLVCGLHTEANLEPKLAGDNRRKNNRVWPDMP